MAADFQAAALAVVVQADSKRWPDFPSPFLSPLWSRISGFSFSSFKHARSFQHPNNWVPRNNSGALKGLAMAERAHSSSDVPNFDTYPATPPTPPVVRTDRELPEPSHSTLEQYAAELGTAAGKVVHMVRQVRENAQHPDHPARDRIDNLAEETRARAEHLRNIAAERARQWAKTAREKATEIAFRARQERRKLILQAKSNYAQTRRRAGEVAHDYPVHVTLAAGAVGFLIGVGLRIRRSHNANR